MVSLTIETGGAAKKARLSPERREIGVSPARGPVPAKKFIRDPVGDQRSRGRADGQPDGPVDGRVPGKERPVANPLLDDGKNPTDE